MMQEPSFVWQRCVIIFVCVIFSCLGQMFADMSGGHYKSPGSLKGECLKGESVTTRMLMSHRG